MALDNFRRIDMRINKANYYIDTQMAKEGDYNGRELVVQITDDGEVKNQSGVSLNLGWRHDSVGNTGLDPFKVVDIAKGIFKIAYPKEMLNAGLVTAVIQVVESGKITLTRNFKITVESNPIDEDAIVSENSFTALTEALVKVNDLEDNYAPRLNEVTAKLAQTEHYMNQLQNVFMAKGLEPYWIETAVEFGFTHGGVPAGVKNYEGGNYVLGISGNEGDEFVTVKSGNIGHAGQTTSWASVIKDDRGNWKPYRVLGTNGVDQVNIYPPLKTNISNGELANIHDAKAGQHYTERGYFALAQHIYNYSPFYADRNKVISKFNPSTDDLESNKWKHVDANPVISVGSVVNSSGLLIKEGDNTLYLDGAGGKTLESYYELELNGKKGFVETHVRTGNNKMIVEFYLDDELVEVIETKPSVLNKIKFRFENADSAKLMVYLQNTTSWSGLAIGRTTWYETDEESNTVIPPHSRLVYLGDSWGEYHNRAVSRELSRLLTRDSGTTIEVLNDSVGGMTSKWGIAWFEEYVIKNRPTHVIIEFFTNDLNSVFNSLPYNYLAPDGQTYSGKIASREEWLNNIKQMANISKRYGIQPIIVAPALVEGDTQILTHLRASNLMFD